MTNKEKYKQAFGTLHASREIILEDNMKNRKYSIGKIAVACLCAALVLGGTVTAFAYGEEILSRVFGWSNNMEIVQQTDGNGEVHVHTDDLTEPAQMEDGRLYFVVNGEHTDITDRIAGGKAYQYHYTDTEGNTHYWILGPVGDSVENYGYGEYIQDPSGEWIGGYSARVNILPDGSTVEWLDNAKAELHCPW